MEKNKNKNRRDSSAILVNCTIGLIISFLLLVGLFFVGDWLNLAEKLNMHFRFDWAATACAFLSAVASIFLALVSVIQNKKAEETNERLAKINRDQLEASIINNNYPLIKFCDLQRIESSGNVLVLKFFDTRNNPLKEVCTQNMVAVPLKGKFENEEVRREIKIREEKVREPLQFTFKNDDLQAGFYMIKVPTKELFDGYRYCRVELEMDLIGTAGVVTKCKGYALLDSKSNHEGMSGREYPHVYHQFFEIKEIMSEQRYREERTLFS